MSGNDSSAIPGTLACHHRARKAEANNPAMAKALKRPMRRKASGRYHHGDLRNALLAAAWSAVEQGGVDSLSLRSLAQALGVSYSAPANHFPNKEDLLDELRWIAWTRFADVLEPGTERSGVLRASGLAYVRFALAHPHMLRLMFRPSARGATPAVLEQSGRAWTNLLRAVALHIGDVALDERVLTALAVAAWAQVHGLAMLWTDVTLPADMSADPKAELLRSAAIDVLLAGVDATAKRVGGRAR
jgi:AcrR family transcriptional regulator